MIKSLQSLRFVFAMMIFWHHYANAVLGEQIPQFGIFPVAFFFILSGFVLEMGYGEKVVREDFCYWGFVKKRLIRIIPLNVIALLLFIVPRLSIEILHGQIDYSKIALIIPDLLLVQSWIPVESVIFSGNSVAWFLSDMLFCYLMFPFLVKWIRCERGYLFVIAVVIGYFAILQIVPEDMTHQLIYVNPLFRLVDFFLGIVVFDLICKLKTCKVSTMCLSLFEMFAVMIAIAFIPLYYFVSERYGSASLYWIPSIILIAVFFISETRNGRGKISLLLGNKLLVELGNLSFAFYMFHVNFVGIFGQICKLKSFHEYPYLLAILCFLATLLVSWVYTKLVEPYFVKILSRYAK